MFELDPEDSNFDEQGQPLFEGDDLVDLRSDTVDLQPGDLAEIR
jgi:hypothetical protein